jgi:hypothetical protein
VLSLEEQLLRRFFEASRLYDRVALEKVAAPGVAYNPVTEGVVGEFTVDDVIEDGNRRTLQATADVTAPSGRRRQLMRVVIERGDAGWRITSLTPLPASRTGPAASSAPPS